MVLFTTVAHCFSKVSMISSTTKHIYMGRSLLSFEFFGWRQTALFSVISTNALFCKISSRLTSLLFSLCVRGRTDTLLTCRHVSARKSYLHFYNFAGEAFCVLIYFVIYCFFAHRNKINLTSDLKYVLNCVL